MNDEARLQKLRDLSARLEINIDFVTKLRQLESYEILFIADDSGSMASPLASQTDPFGKQMTRWDELCQTLSVVIDVASALDKTGVDVYFLNRAPMLGVTDSAQIKQAFQYPPQGFTPIVGTLDAVLAANRSKFGEKNCLLILATDGEPTDANGRVDHAGFDRWMKAKPKKLHMALVAATDNLDDVKHLTKHEKLPFVDVIDDYRSVKASVQKQMGNSFKFSYSDYIVKILLGSIDADMDKLGEKKCSIM